MTDARTCSCRTCPTGPTRKSSTNEKELLGFYVTGHPLDAWIDKVCELGKHSSETLEGLEKGADIAICGIMTGIQRRRNKEGKPWAMFQLEDKLGAVECMVFTTQYEQVAVNVLLRTSRCSSAAWLFRKKAPPPRSR